MALSQCVLLKKKNTWVDMGISFFYFFSTLQPQASCQVQDKVEEITVSSHKNTLGLADTPLEEMPTHKCIVFSFLSNVRNWKQYCMSKADFTMKVTFTKKKENKQQENDNRKQDLKIIFYQNVLPVHVIHTKVKSFAIF